MLYYNKLYRLKYAYKVKKGGDRVKIEENTSEGINTLDQLYRELG